MAKTKICDFMSTENDVKKDIVETQVGVITNKLQKLSNKSNSLANNVDKLVNNLQHLKIEMQGILNKIEENVEEFKDTLNSKLNLILSMISERQLNVDQTLDDCYQIITDLVETFLRIGYQSENDITTLEAKVDNLEITVKEMVQELPLNEFDYDINEPQWLINNESKLTVVKNVSVGSVLMKFCNGDDFEKTQFIKYMSDIFNYYQVADFYWVDLTANQLTGIAQDWWKAHYKNHFMTWTKFVELFMKEPFNSESNEDDIINSPKVEEKHKIVEQQSQTGLPSNSLQPLDNNGDCSER